MFTANLCSSFWFFLWLKICIILKHSTLYFAFLRILLSPLFIIELYLFFFSLEQNVIVNLNLYDNFISTALYVDRSICRFFYMWPPINAPPSKIIPILYGWIIKISFLSLGNWLDISYFLLRMRCFMNLNWIGCSIITNIGG